MTHDALRAGLEAPVPGDVEAIEAVARDYAEGWFSGDVVRMQRCLHPELVKRTIQHDPATGDWRLGPAADATKMVDWTREGWGRTDTPEERAYEIMIDDVFRHIASVRVLSTPYMDYLQVARIGERWWIVNVLWEVREGWTTP